MSQNDEIKTMLAVLGTHLDTVNPDVNLTNAVTHLNTEWTNLANAAATAKKESDIYKAFESCSRGLPTMATGITATIKGFDGGDPLVGSAGIMDICSGVATTIGGLSSMVAAAGPAGAVLSAVFSVVSIFLKMFAPQQASLTVQLEKMIRGIDSEKRVQDLLTAMDALHHFLDVVSSEKLTFTGQEYADMLNLTEGKTITSIRKASHWLEEGANQNQKLWGEVLACQCQAYTLLMHCGTLASARLAVSGAEDRMASMNKLHAAYQANAKIQLEFLRRIRPAVQQRGTVWLIAAGGNDAGDLFFRDSPKEDWKKSALNQRVVSVTRRASSKAAERNPYLAVIALEMANGSPMSPNHAIRNRKNGKALALYGQWPLDKRGVGDWRSVPALDGCTDVCATPGQKEGDVFIYAAKDGAILRYANRADDAFKLVQAKIDSHPNELKGFTTETVCAVANPQFIRPSGRVSATAAYVVYAGVWGSGAMFVWVQFDGGPARRFKLPWPETDQTVIKADQKYLWAFTPKAIACVTHYETKEAATANGELPWIRYDLPAELGGRWKDGENYDGIHDLAPCDDGSLVASISDRGSPKIYETTPVIDLEKRTLVIEGKKVDPATGSVSKTNGWSRINADAHRLQKQAIFCFSLVDGLEDSLRRPMASTAAANPDRCPT